jgi:D-cysteine desulfhydrase
MIHPKEPPRLTLAQLPTPVIELTNLARQVRVSRLMMKRDDLTGLELSGNKIRKLEYLLADARAKGCDTLVTYGGYQSNHCRATAAAGARLGMKVRLILRAPEPEPESDGNLFLDRLFGAEITLHSVEEFNSHRQQLIDEAMESARRDGRKPYYFPVGASVPLGCWGYIRMMHELSQQLGADAEVDVFVAVSSSGTLAGMILGQSLLDLKTWRVRGIPVSDSIDYFQKDIRRLMRETIDAFSLDISEDPAIDLIDGFIGQGYAIPTPAALETTHQVAKAEGIVLDPTYTSKAFSGFLQTMQKEKTQRIPVFVHTGGIFGLFARRDLF